MALSRISLDEAIMYYQRMNNDYDMEELENSTIVIANKKILIPSKMNAENKATLVG